MTLRPPRSTRHDPLYPSASQFRSPRLRDLRGIHRPVRLRPGNDCPTRGHAGRGAGDEQAAAAHHGRYGHGARRHGSRLYGGHGPREHGRHGPLEEDRKSVGEGKGVSGSVDLGGGRITKKKKKKDKTNKEKKKEEKTSK